MDSAIEVRYAGVVVGRATQVKDWTADSAFIGFAEPLPTGTRIELRGDEIREARVEEAIESSDPAICGMRVSFPSSSSSSSSSSFSSPSPSPSSASPDTPAPANQASGGGGGKRRRRR
ncbi:MAG TPA: hypothetical protein VLT58_10150 [Polyangia bacterium]|nr:hypothetical protein [Polyangia bacterium]